MRKMTLGRVLRALNGKQMNLGHKGEKTTLGRGPKALNRNK